MKLGGGSLRRFRQRASKGKSRRHRLGAGPKWGSDGDPDLSCDSSGPRTIGVLLATKVQSITLERARSVLAGERVSGSLGSISLASFDFSRELEIGDGMRLIAVSNAFSGGLAAFRKDGSAIATVTTGRITWLQLFDLNEDGVSEVVTEEVDGRGTGILTKSFAVYVVSSSTIKDTWRRESYFMEAPWDPTRPNADPPVQERRSFLRFDEGGTGRRASMTYLTPSPNGAGFGATVFEMTADSVRERPQAGR